MMTVLTALLCLCACGEKGGESTAAPAASTLPPIDITVPAVTTKEQTEAVTTEKDSAAEPVTSAAVPSVNTTAAGEDQKPGVMEESDLTLTVDGVALSLGMDFAPIAGTILGGAYDELVGQACVGGGNDRTYYYEGESYCIFTLGSADGVQSIYDIYIDGVEGFATAKGAEIGKTTKDEIREIYGEPSFTTPAALRYTLEERSLVFGFNGDILSSVGIQDKPAQ